MAESYLASSVSAEEIFIFCFISKNLILLRGKRRNDISQESCEECEEICFFLHNHKLPGEINSQLGTPLILLQYGPNSFQCKRDKWLKLFLQFNFLHKNEK